MAVMLRPPCDEGVALGAPAAAVCGRSVRPWVLAATILGSSLAFIDGTVVTVALPVIQQAFAGTVADVQWIVESYAPPGGPAVQARCRRILRRRVSPDHDGVGRHGPPERAVLVAADRGARKSKGGVMACGR